tara:strand:+ start:274 stop:576 length:303 start_codon:yes stop_codon:yes gene_type:complete
MTWEHIDYRLTPTEQAHRMAKFCREWKCGPHEVKVDDKGTCTYIGTRPRTNGMFRIEQGYVSYHVDVKRSMKPEDYQEYMKMVDQDMAHEIEMKRILRED